MSQKLVWVLGGGTVVAGAAVFAVIARGFLAEPDATAPVDPVPLMSAQPLAAPDAAGIAAPTDDVAQAVPETTPVPLAPGQSEQTVAAPAPDLPLFDVVRVARDGETLVAGTASPGAAVSLRVDGAIVAQTAADATGQFVALFSLGYSDAAQMMTLEAEGAEGTVLASEDTVILTPRRAQVAVAQMPDVATDAIVDADRPQALALADTPDPLQAPSSSDAAALSETVAPVVQSIDAQAPQVAAVPVARDNAPNDQAAVDAAVATPGAAPLVEPSVPQVATLGPDVTLPGVTSPGVPSQATSTQTAAVSEPVSDAPVDVALATEVAADAVPTTSADGADPVITALDTAAPEIAAIETTVPDRGDTLRAQGAAQDTAMAATSEPVPAEVTTDVPAETVVARAETPTTELAAVTPTMAPSAETVAAIAQPQPEAQTPLAPVAQVAAETTSQVTAELTAEAAAPVAEQGAAQTAQIVSQPIETADTPSAAPRTQTESRAVAQAEIQPETGAEAVQTALAPAAAFQPAATQPETTVAAATTETAVTAAAGAASVAEDPATQLALAEDMPTAFLVRGNGEVEVLDRAPQVADNVVIDSISYSALGDVLIAGRAARSEPSSHLRIYLDNQPIAVATASRGDWASDLPDVDPGVYTLRVDQLSDEGHVVSRFETPFQREDPELVIAAQARTTASARAADQAVVDAGLPDTNASGASASGASVLVVEPSNVAADQQLASVQPGVDQPAQGPVSGTGTGGTVTADMAETAARGDLTASASAAQSAQAVAPASAAPSAPVSLITVQPGHTLWAISNERYGAGELYVVIYRANRAQIRNPDLIYPGQIFTLPDN